ncbi:VOC family protein [Fulvivirgaceae bacterium BMA12]|uniref:VOC family protein n=1 Tax=Agaribacillus aureus TaxID=3051825 RepID=A0ABT8KYT1_9BACT|nr:VOC family protein [Fulvivirgaceae bacterium BMA12]
MENSDYQIRGFTIAVTNMEEMVNFYREVFEIRFTKVPKYGVILYEGKFGRMKMLMCPADIARNTARQNRHQFDIIVKSLDNYKQKILENGGVLIENVTENNDCYAMGFKDPDGNSMVLIEYK